MTTIRPKLPTAPTPALEGAAPVSTNAPAAVSPASVKPAGVSSASSPQAAVLGDLQAARITPDEAVRRLTDLALDQARVPVAMRPAVEARIRATLSHDPLLGALLRRMGAAVPDESAG